MSREVLRLASLKPELQRNNHQRFLSHLPLPPDTSIQVPLGLTQHLWLLRTFIPRGNPGSNPPPAGRLFLSRTFLYGLSFPAERKSCEPVTGIFPPFSRS